LPTPRFIPTCGFTASSSGAATRGMRCCTAWQRTEACRWHGLLYDGMDYARHLPSEFGKDDE
jgi:hypothetical protein